MGETEVNLKTGLWRFISKGPKLFRFSNYFSMCRVDAVTLLMSYVCMCYCCWLIIIWHQCGRHVSVTVGPLHQEW